MESPEGDTLPRPPPDAGDKGLRGGAAQERPTALPREGAGKGGTEGGDAEVENARRASPRAGTEDTGMHHRVVRRYIQMEPDTTATLWWGLLHQCGVSSKDQNRSTTGSSNSSSGYLPKEIQNTDSKSSMHPRSL